MTGLLNRQGLYTIAESLRHASFSAVYLFELDDLKKFNEKYGYVEGRSFDLPLRLPSTCPHPDG